jgi:hypothetical protein
MLKYKTKYGFISTNEDTVFLMVGLNNKGEACLFFSPSVSGTAQLTIGQDDKEGTDSTISLRSAMLYFTFLCGRTNPDDWYLSANIVAQTKDWVRETAGKPVEYEPSTPYRNPKVDDLVASMMKVAIQDNEDETPVHQESPIEARRRRQ